MGVKTRFFIFFPNFTLSTGASQAPDPYRGQLMSAGRPRHNQHTFPHPHPPQRPPLREPRRQRHHKTPNRHLLLHPWNQPVTRDQAPHLRLPPAYHQQSPDHLSHRQFGPLRPTLPQAPQMLQLPLPECARRRLYLPISPLAQELRVHQEQVNLPCPLTDNHLHQPAYRNHAAFEQPPDPRMPQPAQQS